MIFKSLFLSKIKGTATYVGRLEAGKISLILIVPMTYGDSLSIIVFLYLDHWIFRFIRRSFRGGIIPSLAF